ncbi:hypothetical protein AVEN_207696-1 [Araneus ventricosus]|uniref:Sphingomyelin phosphodiesterase C-terminal domain-containing protein n=2 Tax=Araneus ventricosus TaxID=182803 RepID=A0A4Y2SY14_ARAVE|nr:hypothetical protein AVEN_207696-1 [Araneus ventricosus]
MDMFQLFRDRSGEFKGSSLLTPPVTPWYEGKGQNVSLPANPSIRLVYYSLDDFKLLDYRQYVLNLTTANCDRKERKKTYELLYSLTTFYGVEDLTTKSLVKVFQRLKRNSNWFDEFFRFLTAGMETVDCEKTCRVAQICAMTGITPYHYDTCWNASDKLFYTKQLSSPKNSIIIFICISILPIIILLLIIGYILYKKFKASQNKTE